MNNQWTLPQYQPVYYPEFNGNYLIEQFNTTLFSGVLCGLLPLVVALARGRADWGFRILGLCFVAGILKGYLLAGPVALAMTAVVLIGDPNARAKWNLWFGWEREPVPATEVKAVAVAMPVVLVPVDPAAIAPESAPPITLRPVAVATPGGAAGLCCPSCATPVLPNGDRMPPWCSRCGADLKVPRPA